MQGWIVIEQDEFDFTVTRFRAFVSWKKATECFGRWSMRGLICQLRRCTIDESKCKPGKRKAKQ